MIKQREEKKRKFSDDDDERIVSHEYIIPSQVVQFKSEVEDDLLDVSSNELKHLNDALWDQISPYWKKTLGEQDYKQSAQKALSELEQEYKEKFNTPPYDCVEQASYWVRITKLKGETTTLKDVLLEMLTKFSFGEKVELCNGGEIKGYPSTSECDEIAEYALSLPHPRLMVEYYLMKKYIDKKHHPLLIKEFIKLTHPR